MKPTLSEIAHRTLEVVTVYFAANNITLPKRKLVVPGIESAWDDEQVTCAFRRIAAGPPGSQIVAGIQHQVSVRSAEFSVEIVRKAASLVDSAILIDAEMQKDFEVGALDAVTLLECLENARANYLIVDQGTPFALTDVYTKGPAGALVSVQADFTVQVM